MKNLLNPKWIFIINTLPIVLLLFIFYGEFQIIKTLLKDENIMLWKAFGFSLVGLGILNFGYGIYLVFTQQKVTFHYAVIALICYIAFIYLYGVSVDKIFPFTIPRWMGTADIFLYVGTFLMPTLAYSLLIIVVHFTPEDEPHTAWQSFLISLSIPIGFYVFVQVILPLLKPLDEHFTTHFFIVGLITITLVFFFFLIRGIFILITNKMDDWGEFQLVWKIVISIIFPLIGLLVNASLFSSGPDDGIFGNFNSYWFYLLAFINGIFICLPNFEDKHFRLLLYIGRWATFSYTLYFFLVFLPFLPLSILAIIAIGVGFLMLTPVLLFITHLNQLSEDFNYLKSYFSKPILWSSLTFGFLFLPTTLTINYLKDRKTLNQALDYVYNPDFDKIYEIDKASLKSTLQILKKQKGRDFGISTKGQPYLTTYFKWIVLDNLMLSDVKINSIENIFFGTSRLKKGQFGSRNEDVEITKISSNSTYDASQKAWKSWVNFEITNKNKERFSSEYVTTFELPEGVWISDYYLFVGDKKEMGILSEKKTAKWIFTNIVNERKDPGILYYLTGNKIAFRVFPFAAGEVRKTGIELLHKEPFQFSIDGNEISLGNSEINDTAIVENETAIYVSAKQKQQLKKVRRSPYFHFIVNTSDKNKMEEFFKRIESLRNKHIDLMKNAKISFVNSYVSTIFYNKNWSKYIEAKQNGGGFFVDRAIKTILFQSEKQHAASYPVMVVVTDDFQNAFLKEDFSDWDFSFPESDLFYNLTNKNELEPHSLRSNPYNIAKAGSNILWSDKNVLEYQLADKTTRYLPNNDKPSIVLKTQNGVWKETKSGEKNWDSGLTMQAQWISTILHPEKSEEEWRMLVKNSFISKIMTPVTSYLVVENEAQKAMLAKKQKQVLAGRKSLDLDEETERMSEPSTVILVILLGFVLWLRYLKKKRKEVMM